MFDEKTEETHESYGLVQFNRTSGQFDNLFGTNVGTNTAVRLVIRRAKVMRSLSRTWTFDDGELIEVTLSPNQFSELLTTMNSGSGVPCTINHIDMKRMAPPPQKPSEVEVVRDDFRKECEKIEKQMKEFRVKIEEILAKKSILKEDKDVIKSHLHHIHQEVRSNLPFIMEQFQESANDIVQDAKAVVDSFVTTAITNAGIKAIEDNGGIVTLPRLEKK